MKTPRSIVLWMVATIVAIGALGYWDAVRESDAALGDFAHEQAMLARSVAGRPVDEPGRILVLIASGEALATREGRTVHSPVIEEAVATGRPSVRLTRAEAAALGLPERTAVAGIAVSTPGDGAARATVVVATALRERDREKRAQARLALGFLLSSTVVLAFGMLALREQRRQFELERDLAVAGVVRDRDARLERADKLATLGALGIGIAHEVSTPLGVIVGRAEQLAARVQGDERASRAVAAISEQADRIGKIIRAMLGLARGGKATFERVAPSAVAREALDLVRHRFEKASVRLSSDLEADLPGIDCDRELFIQVLTNLLLNACQACVEGGRVDLRACAREGRVVFEVLDEGHGVAPDVLAQATEPFFTTRSPEGGTGLGLAIAREIVMHHHGALRLAGRADGRQGTSATVEVAVAPGGSHA